MPKKTEDKIIKFTSVAVEPHVKEKLKKLSAQHGMKMYELLDNMADYFIEFNEHPNSKVSKKALRQTIVSFIKEQEKRYHSPNKNDLALLVKMTSNLQDEMKFLFDYLKTKK